MKWDPLLRIFLTKMGTLLKDIWLKTNPFGQHMTVCLNMWVPSQGVRPCSYRKNSMILSRFGLTCCMKVSSSKKLCVIRKAHWAFCAGNRRAKQLFRIVSSDWLTVLKSTDERCYLCAEINICSIAIAQCSELKNSYCAELNFIKFEIFSIDILPDLVTYK